MCVWLLLGDQVLACILDQANEIYTVKSIDYVQLFFTLYFDAIVYVYVLFWSRSQFSSPYSIPHIPYEFCNRTRDFRGLRSCNEIT